MKPFFGPILGLRGAAVDTWSLSALIVSETKAVPRLAWRSARRKGDAVGRLIGTPQGQFAYRYDFSVGRDSEDTTVEYALAQSKYECVVPARGNVPRMAYASCNGFSNPGDMKRYEHKNALWTNLLEAHRTKPFHLLLLGGDQVYSDSIWEQVPTMKAWADLRRGKRRDAAFDAAMRKETDRFYFELYVSRWSQEELAEAFSRIPSLMMWDDHDIFDGWGSYPTKDLRCDVYKGIFGIAKEYFRLFQLQLEDKEPSPAAIPRQDAFSYAHQLGDVAVLALDMRSERTMDQVLSKRSWDAVYDWMDSLPNDSHLLAMTSIPVVHPDFGMLEVALRLLPGRQELEDDLKDHWNSHSHKEERLRFIHRLLTLSTAKRCRVTLLSGDVHVAAIGIIDSKRNPGRDRYTQVINQLTSSGIVHPPPPGMALHCLEALGQKEEEADRDITTRMLPFPGTARRFIGSRNWLSLQRDDEKRIWCEWHVEETAQTFTKVIHPCS